MSEKSETKHDSSDTFALDKKGRKERRSSNSFSCSKNTSSKHLCLNGYEKQGVINLFELLQPLTANQSTLKLRTINSQLFFAADNTGSYIA